MSKPTKPKREPNHCGQCGCRYTSQPCGPTHAMLAAEYRRVSRPKRRSKP